jgi:hypothetical protein
LPQGFASPGGARWRRHVHPPQEITMNNHRVARYATIAVALTAIGAPTASARPDPPIVAPADSRSLDARIADWRTETARVLARDATRDDVRPAGDGRPTPAADSDDIDRGKAGIGAGAVLLGLGAVGFARRRAALRGV